MTLTESEVKARNHGLLCAIGFLILLPLGTLFARYARTFTNNWLYAHWLIQVLVAGPIILAGWILGYQLSGAPHFVDTHQQIGLALLVLYIIQVFIAPIVHWFKLHSIFHGHRAPHNYLHILLGLTILALASYQVNLGLDVEWYAVSALPIPSSAKQAWLALTILFWALYGIGWAFIPRQLKQEAEFRRRLKNDWQDTQEDVENDQDMQEDVKNDQDTQEDVKK